MISYRSLAIATLGFASAATPALAEDATEATPDIVVVGTLIRGTQTTGSQTVNISTEAIAAKAANSTNELLQLVPQITNTFNGRFEGDPRGAAAGISITKPNLRALPGANSSSGGTTLVIADGFRMTPVGVNQSSIDVDIIPAAVIAGMDVVTDGGSSLYGADAVAGVINFRTLRKFEGVKVDANYGFGSTIKNFSQWDGQITVGKSWSTGNAYLSGGYSSRDPIRNKETWWANGLVYNAAGTASYAGTQCNSAVGTQVRYAYVRSVGVWTSNPLAGGATIPIGTACDDTGDRTYLAGQKRYNLFGQVTNDFSDKVSLRVTGYWTKRDQVLPNLARGYTTPAQPAPTGAPGTAGAPASSPVTLLGGTGFSFAPNPEFVDEPSRIGFDTWGITPELTVGLGHDWQVRTTVHYGRSFNYQRFPDINQTLAQCYISGCTAANSPTGAAIAAGQLNPLNVAAAAPGVVASLMNYENAQETKQQLFVARSIVDGPVFALPGGDAKVAVGAEYQVNSAQSHLLSGAIDAVKTVPWMKYSRHAYSLFGELSAPVTSFLDLSASVRHDHYSDFGTTTNPNLGFTLKPASWVKFYGHWNKSFNAPTAVDGLGIAVGRFALAYTAGVGSARRPTDPFGKDNGVGTFAILSEGVRPGLKPQTADSWALGLELTPTSGLRVGGEFYSIDFKNVLAAINAGDSNTFRTNPELYAYNPALAAPAAAGCPATAVNQYQCILSTTMINGATLLAQHPLVTDIALYADRRTANLGTAKLQGVDFHAYYDTTLGKGMMSLGVAGTKQTKSLSNFGVIKNERGSGSPQFTFSAFAAYRIGGLSTRATLNYSGAWSDTAPDVANVIGSRISPFKTVNLNIGYEYGEDAGALSGTSLRLTVDNLFMEKPQITPRNNTTSPSYVNWTLGRVIKMGFSKKF